MIIDFIIEDLMLNSYLQKNFHTLEHPELFLPFLEKYVVNGVPNSFPASWIYIKEDNHSLERHTNLHIYFSKHPAL